MKPEGQAQRPSSGTSTPPRLRSPDPSRRPLSDGWGQRRAGTARCPGQWPMASAAGKAPLCRASARMQLAALVAISITSGCETASYSCAIRKQCRYRMDRRLLRGLRPYYATPVASALRLGLLPAPAMVLAMPGARRHTGTPAPSFQD